MLSTTAPTFAATSQHIHPTLDMVALSYTSTANNSLAKGGPNPFRVNQKLSGIDWLATELPAGSDYFWTLVQVAAIPKGKHVLKVEIINPQGKVTGVDTAKFNSRTAFYDDSSTIKWSSITIARGYNTFKVFLDDKYLGQALYWGTR